MSRPVADVRVRDLEITVRVNATRPILRRLLRRFALVDLQTNTVDPPSGPGLKHGDTVCVTMNFHSSPL